MRQVLCAVFVILLCVVKAPMAFGEADRAGSKDYPGISRMPGYYIEDYKESKFDSFTFTITEDGKDKQIPVEGHRYSYRYDRKKDAQQLSDFAVVRNFQNAIRSAGGEVLRETVEGMRNLDTTMRFTKEGHEVWMAITTLANCDVYLMEIIEKQAMQQDVTVDAKAMAHDLGNSGRVAIYGIFFDIGKSELKPGSEPSLIEIAKLLNQRPTLRVYIVGHTDMVADLGLNMRLSQERAQAVVDALVSKHGISGNRLIAFGNGPYAPVASNKTEEGRTKNRRIELVEIEIQ